METYIPKHTWICGQSNYFFFLQDDQYVWVLQGRKGRFEDWWEGLGVWRSGMEEGEEGGRNEGRVKKREEKEKEEWDRGSMGR